MAKEYDIDFPRYINDYPLLVVFPLDQVFVFFTGLFLTFWILSMFTYTIIALVVGVLTGLFSYFQYAKFKKETAPGFIFHTFYVMGIASINPHETDEEMLEMDVESFLPEGYETEFID